MATLKRVLSDHFEQKTQLKPALKPAVLRPQPHPAKCKKDFSAAGEERKEKIYLSELEQVLLSIGAMHCLGFGKRHAQDERINRLLLSLLTGKIPPNSRLTAELQQVINRRSARTGIGLKTGRAFSCSEKHELRPIDEDRPDDRMHDRPRRTVSLAPSPRPGLRPQPSSMMAPE